MQQNYICINCRGRIEENESIAEGLYREILEETGCSVAETRELGIVVEYRDTIELLQISYVFTAMFKTTQEHRVY